MDNPRGLFLFYLKILDKKSLKKIYKNSMFKKIFDDKTKTWYYKCNICTKNVTKIISRNTLSDKRYENFKTNCLRSKVI